MATPNVVERFDSYSLGDTPYPNLFEQIFGPSTIYQRSVITDTHALSGTKSSGTDAADRYANIYVGTAEYGSSTRASGSVWLDHHAGTVGDGTTDLLYATSYRGYLATPGVAELSATTEDGLQFFANPAFLASFENLRSSPMIYETGWYSYEVRIRGTLQGSEMYCAVTTPSGRVALPGEWETTGMSFLDTQPEITDAEYSYPALEGKWHITYDNPPHTYWDNLSFYGVTATEPKNVRMYPIYR